MDAVRKAQGTENNAKQCHPRFYSTLNHCEIHQFRVLDLTTLILQGILKIVINVIIYVLHTVIVRNRVKQKRR